MTTATLQFYKARGLYYATTTRRYVIRKVSDGWILEIFKVNMVAGVPTRGEQVDASYSETKREAVRYANIYEGLGDDYRPSEHGHRERGTEAGLVLHEQLMAEMAATEVPQ